MYTPDGYFATLSKEEGIQQSVIRSQYQNAIYFQRRREHKLVTNNKFFGLR